MLLAAIFSSFFGLLRSAEYCSPSPRRLDPGVHLQYSALTLDPERGVAGLRIKASKTDPFGGGGGGGRPCASAAPAPHYVPSPPRYTSCLAHTPPSSARCSHSRRVILDPGPLGAHPPRGIPFLLRPEHPVLPHRGRVRRGCHGLLLGHDPGPRAVEERLLQALHTATLQICVPSPATHVEVFGVTRGHSGPPPTPPPPPPGSDRAWGGGARRSAIPVDYM